MSNIKVNEDRLWQSLMTHGKIGDTHDGGVCRMTLSDEDREGRDLFARWCLETDMTMGVDDMGNMFATIDGSDPTLDPVAIGSHLDTQPTGGKFDGVLGVLAGLEIARCLKESNYKPRRPIVVVNWTNEEGARFSPALLSSGVFVGKYTTDYAYGRTDVNGENFENNLKKIGYKGSEKTGSRKFHCFLELHIEQGPILENTNNDIGIVTGVQAQSMDIVTIRGQEAHAGSTPMENRLDSFSGAVQVITALQNLARTIDDMRLTIGTMTLQPATSNVIPHTTQFTLDIRHPDDIMHAKMTDQLHSVLNHLQTQGFTTHVERPLNNKRQNFDEDCLDAIRNATAKNGYSGIDMVSGAGHDAANIATVCPTAMIFTPCKDGMSHTPKELITPQQASSGCQVLLDTVLAMAK